MPERVTSFGFPERKARVLSGMADAESGRNRGGGGTGYPQTLPQGRGIFCLTLAELAAGDKVSVRRIKRKDDNTDWELSTEDAFDAYDIQLNDGETLDTNTVVYVVPYDGVMTILTMYCAAADWIGV